MASLKNRLLYAAVFLLIGSTSIVHATLIVDTSAGRFDVSANLVGTFNTLVAILDDQPWWGNLTLAEEFVAQVGGQLGLPNTISAIDFGPVFASNTPTGSSTIYGGCMWISSASPAPICSLTNLGHDGRVRTFATATQITVPEPSTLYLIGRSIASLGWSQRKRA